LDDSERSNRLQNVYSARDNRELASAYDEWAENYEDDMLSLGYAIPAVAAGFVGRYVPFGGTVLFASLLIVAANLVIDLLYSLLDPRITYG
jgi:hypothetical protein